LNKVDSGRYSDLLNKLRFNRVFFDDIKFSAEGVVTFRIKAIKDKGELHVHELIRLGENSTKYIQNDALLDSTIDDSWRYVYHKGPVGH
jgi:hypothetical protein